MRGVANAYKIPHFVSVNYVTENINFLEAIKMVELYHKKHSVGQCAYHLVWKPKYNVKVFTHPWVRELCEDSLKKTAEVYGFEIYELQVMPDHVHLFVELLPTVSVSKALQLFKGRSARDIFKRCNKWYNFFKEGHKIAHLWSPGKFFRSVGNVSADVIENYIKFSQGKWDLNFLGEQKTLEVRYPVL